MARAVWVIPYTVLACAWLASGCSGARGFPDAAIHSPVARPSIDPPEGQAVFVAFHGGSDASNIVLLDAEGNPVCQVPSGAHCAMALTPGHYRIYVAWTRGFVDAWDLDVVAGRRYFATMAVGWSFVNEKLTPQSENWGNLGLYMQGEEVSLDPSQAAALQDALGDVSRLVEMGEQRMSRYDERHVEAHTIHPEDGI